MIGCGAGKGDKRRPQFVSDEEFERNWDLAFKHDSMERHDFTVFETGQLKICPSHGVIRVPANMYDCPVCERYLQPYSSEV